MSAHLARLVRQQLPVSPEVFVDYFGFHDEILDQNVLSIYE